MEYNFRQIEQYWQQQWKEEGVYKVTNDPSRPKYYVLDMFPYPSGAGLHVGHPLGYIASDIYARYKRLKGFNVLHPMGYDAFGLPAEQYAIEHGIHPAVSTKTNIENFRKQLDKIGFCYDWDRQVNTSDPAYYKWTQWIFLQLFQSFYNRKTKKAEHIKKLVTAFEQNGNKDHPVPNTGFRLPVAGSYFTAAEWKNFDEKTQQDILMEYRLAYCGYGEVNWCEGLGTVLANDEVVNGVSERGGYPVVKKKLRQWYLRITEYADRLLEGLERIEFSEAMKEMQTNWIGKSSGAEIDFAIRFGEAEETARVYQEGDVLVKDITIAESVTEESLRVYTTRPDTIFGVDFMVIAPEHALVAVITTDKQKQEVEDYLEYVQSRSERERMAEKKISGVFTGSYAINPFNGHSIPIWISEYVLAGYGTGAIMAVPCGDERDHKFARHFNIPVTNIIGSHYNGEEANATKEAVLENSDFLDGLVMRDAIEVVIKKIEETGIGTRKVNYKMRDAAFSRQRYWGEPFPIVWKDGIAYPLDEKELPLELPHVDSYKPGPEGEGPLANIKNWTSQFETAIPPLGGGGAVETNTMPGYAGSSWYFLRYMDPHNDQAFCSRGASDYWGQVDLYIGGTEHAVGHLLYSRMWTKVLYDLGFIGHDEPYKKLVNQGMIQGSSRFVYRLNEKGIESLLHRTLRDNFPEHDFVIEAGFSEWKYMDFVSHGSGIAVEVTSAKNFHSIDINEHRNPAIKDYQHIFLSNDEVIERLADNTLADFLAGLFKTKARYVSRTKKDKHCFYSVGLIEPEEIDNFNRLHVDVNIVDGAELNIEGFKKWRPEYENAEFVLENGKYICGTEVEKMSKSKFNTVNPDDLVYKYGADTFRMYEMFLGPVEMSKPWDTKGIEGVSRFLKKFWRLFADEEKGLIVTDEAPAAEELKVLHNTIRKIESDTERFSFNTGVSNFMIATNELTDLKCHKKQVLEPLLILLAPYAPHIAEELWHLLDNTSCVLDAAYPVFEEKYVKESAKAYPVAINGKTRTELTIALDATQQQVEAIVLADETVQKWLEGKQPKKVIYVKNKMINLVV